MTSLVWLRRSLRLYDNPGLHLALESSQSAIVLYIDCPQQDALHQISPHQRQLVKQCWNSVSQSLNNNGIQTIWLDGSDYADLPHQLEALCRQHQVEHIYYQKEYLLNEQQRDKAVYAMCQQHGIQIHAHHGFYLVPPGKVTKSDGAPYKVYTPFKKAFIQQLLDQPLAPKPLPDALSTSQSAVADPILDRLSEFIQTQAPDYKAKRDFPAQNATSQLSAALAIGQVSPRQCLASLLANYGPEIYDPQHACHNWLSQLIWRDFYGHIAWHFPQVIKGKAFKEETDNIAWHESPSQLAAWQSGQTGFPIVDAGMRQLNQTGWMHNRVRMIVASFLTKDLFINWREGEQYFMRHLIDADFANNNGGWQWAASTGTDAAPYFRVFNPTTQSERFDPNGDYIRRYVPELSGLSGKQIHNPPNAIRKQVGYPEAMVDHKAARQYAIDIFKALG